METCIHWKVSSIEAFKPLSLVLSIHATSDFNQVVSETTDAPPCLGAAPEARPVLGQDPLDFPDSAPVSSPFTNEAC